MEKHGLKVLSYNIHKGFTMNNRRFVLSRMREAIRSVHPDVVFLQEVLGEHETHRRRHSDWPQASQFEFLAEELWPHFAYGKNAVYTTGHHGNAILSKFPIVSWENIDISTNRLESRGLLHAAVHLPDRKQDVHVMCVHLGLWENERLTQIQRLCRRIESHVPHRDPLVIGGDFNDWRVRISRHLERILEVQEAFQETQGSHARTFPSWLPALRLDRVYYRGLKARRARCLTGKPWSELSDHAALYVELELER